MHCNLCDLENLTIEILGVGTFVTRQNKGSRHIESGYIDFVSWKNLLTRDIVDIMKVTVWSSLMSFYLQSLVTVAV